jgi:hypothetical protein
MLIAKRAEKSNRDQLSKLFKSKGFLLEDFCHAVAAYSLKTSPTHLLALHKAHDSPFSHGWKYPMTVKARLAHADLV